MSFLEKPKIFNIYEVKEIPILEVCAHLGISTQKRGKNYWCKLRDERNASTILHTDKNTFYDFGTQQGGSNIDLYCAATGVSFHEAIEELGNAFHLTPESYEERKNQYRRMSRSDYRRIGLYFDLATKNFRFDVEHLSLNQLVAIERKYRMDMNQLRKEHPGVYSRVIREKAVPYVTALRNQYYLKAWNHYCLLRSAGCSYLFFMSSQTLPLFEESKRRLEQAEWSLQKAAIDTDLKLPWMATPDAIRVVSRILQGSLTIWLGTESLETLSQKVRQNGHKVSEAREIQQNRHNLSGMTEIQQNQQRLSGVTEIQQNQQSLSELTETQQNGHNLSGMAENQQDRAKLLDFVVDQDTFFDLSYQNALDDIPYAAEMNKDSVQFWISSRDLDQLKEKVGPRWASLQKESLDRVIEAAQTKEKAQTKIETEIQFTR